MVKNQLKLKCRFGVYRWNSQSDTIHRFRHLHAFNNIGTVENPVVYSSSPLCYSFSEAGQTKFVVLINVQPNTTAHYEKKKH